MKPEDVLALIEDLKDEKMREMLRRLRSKQYDLASWALAEWDGVDGFERRFRTMNGMPQGLLEFSKRAG